MGTYNVIFVYCMEHFGGKWSVFFGVGFQFPWAVGFCALPAIAYAVPDWVWLQLTVSVPLVLFIPIGVFMPESPKWLLSNGKIEKAEKVVKKIVKFNKKKCFLSDDVKLEPLTLNAENEAKFADLFKTPNLRKVTLIQYFIWFSTALVNFGLNINGGVLLPDASFYINFLLGGILQFPAYGLAILVIVYTGRRIPLSGTFFLGGISLFVMLAVLDDNTWSLVFSNIGKFGMSASFAIVYLYAAEIFPTVLRASGLGSSSMWARIGGIVAPIVGVYLGEIDRVIPIVIFAVLSTVAGIVSLLLPETGGKKLPDTVDEGEAFAAQDSSVFTACWKKIR